MEPAFQPGDRVAWDHEFSTPHASGSIVREDAIPEHVAVGTVQEVANAEGTYFEVVFDQKTEDDFESSDEFDDWVAKYGDPRTLTNDELVRVLPTGATVGRVEITEGGEDVSG